MSSIDEKSNWPSSASECGAALIAPVQLREVREVTDTTALPVPAKQQPG